MATPSQAEIITAYRNVYKQLLRAVQYSKPARFTCRDRVRAAFRDGKLKDYDAVRIARTIQFLDGATKSVGLEHKILKNLMHVWWVQRMKVPWSRM